MTDDNDKKAPFERLKARGYKYVQFNAGDVVTAHIVLLPRGARVGTVGVRGNEVSIYIDETTVQQLKVWLNEHK